MSDWYGQIEEPIRSLVKHLRDHGFNTTCSCGHEMYVEGEMSDLGATDQLYRLVYDFGWKDFEVTVQVGVVCGIVMVRSFCVREVREPPREGS